MQYKASVPMFVPRIGRGRSRRAELGEEGRKPQELAEGSGRDRR
jgi:hypothetical protein